MAEVSFPSPWKVWTQSQREGMFRDYVEQTCKQRGYSNAREWHSYVTRGKHNLSGHLDALIASSRRHMDTYKGTTVLARLAVHHLCPDDSGSGSSGSGTPLRTARQLMGALAFLPALFFPWLIRPQPEMVSFSGIVFGGATVSADIVSTPFFESSDASPFDSHDFFIPFVGGEWMCGAASISSFPAAAVPVVP